MAPNNKSNDERIIIIWRVLADSIQLKHPIEPAPHNKRISGQNARCAFILTADAGRYVERQSRVIYGY